MTEPKDPMLKGGELISDAFLETVSGVLEVLRVVVISEPLSGA